MPAPPRPKKNNMQIPKRKPGKYTNERPDPNLTKTEFNKLKSKLTELKLSLPRAADEVRRLAEMGDFSENAAYQMAKGRLRGINQRILELEDQLKYAVIIKPAKDAQIVQIGHKVTIEEVSRHSLLNTKGWRDVPTAVGTKEKTYLILGSEETDPLKGVISQNSPLGSVLLGHKLGDIIKIPPKGVEWKIVRIE